jgi:hypothetical protein
MLDHTPSPRQSREPPGPATYDLFAAHASEHLRHLAAVGPPKLLRVRREERPIKALGAGDGPPVRLLRRRSHYASPWAVRGRAEGESPFRWAVRTSPSRRPTSAVAALRPRSVSR